MVQMVKECSTVGRYLLAQCCHSGAARARHLMTFVQDVKRTGIPSHNEYITVDAGETITQTITVESDYQ